MSFHEDPNFASITVHEEVVDLVDVVRLLDEHDKFLLFVTRSFHSTFEYFFCRNLPGIRVNVFAFRVASLSFLGARHK